MLSEWLNGGQCDDVPCIVEIECSFDSFHVHAIPEGVYLRPGDQVIIHNAPTVIEYGMVGRFPCRAAVIRAGFFRRLWTRYSAVFEITELYHCGFEPKELT